MKKLLFALIVFCLTASLEAVELNLPFMDKNTIGANEFIKQNSQNDGRNIVIFILDSGVDPSIKGLRFTSQGKVKVIEMQDFSGQTVINLIKAKKEKIKNTDVLTGDNIKLKGYEKLKFKPYNDKYYIGKIDEKLNFKNSSVKDINSNGKTDDVFGVLAFQVDNYKELFKNAKGFIKPKKNEKIWVFYIDENADGRIDDESEKLNYHFRFDTFNFYNGEKDKKPQYAMSANIRGNDSPELVVNTADNAHGSHCSGIAAGYKINGQDGLNGIAPGAYIASLKIGNDVLSGGATTTSSMKKAYEYGVKFLKEAGFKYGVFSMSYGIGSETPGRSEMEKFLTQFAKDHPNVTIVKSMGNSGPGINTSGNPSNVKGTITVGAMISPNTLRDLYGSSRRKNWITHFSSRGGCVNEPDVVAPGAAASTVPAYSRGDAFWGTSMSTPQVAGACALLLSAAVNDSLDVNNAMVKRAVKYTASPLKGYLPLDYGGGLVNVSKAYKYLKILAKRPEKDRVLYYKIKTTNTFFNDEKDEAVYWNVGGYVPDKSHKQSITISPVFPEKTTEKEKAGFYRVFSLKSDASWFNIDKSNIYIRGSHKASFSITFDKSKLKKPGLYNSKIVAYAKSEENGGFPEFDIPVTVIVPFDFSADNNYQLKLKSQELGIGDIGRYYLNIPPAASSLAIELNSKDKNSNLTFYLYSPQGKEVHRAALTGGEAGLEKLRYQLSDDNIHYGVWELIPYCYFKSSDRAKFDIDVRFYGLKSNPEIINDISFESGEKPKGNFKIANLFKSPIVINARGYIRGYYFDKDYDRSGEKRFEKEFKVGNDINKVVFKLDIPIESFNKMTDVAVNIYNSQGKSILSSGLTRKSKIFTFYPPHSGKFTLEIVPAFASDELLNDGWDFNLKEEYYYKSAIGIKVDQNYKTLYPSKWYDFDFTLSKAYPIAPDGSITFGEILFYNYDNNDLIKKISIKIER
ncbi:MAG: S8 family serine peptidase [Chlorobi bacterium]|nr:S8 family serine peptidase [Chlorobiota bacterium]